MGEALLAGLRVQVPARQIVVTAKTRARVREVSRKCQVKGMLDNRLAVRGADVVVFCVKPQILPAVMAELQGALTPNQLIISIAAGVPLARLATCFPDHPIVRAMPNQPARLSCGVTGVVYGRRVRPLHRKLVGAMFATLGAVYAVKESQMDAVTAVGGSGPGFLYYMADALIVGGVRAGLSPALANALVRDVFWGVGNTLHRALDSPQSLCEAVTSPRGTTWAGLSVLKRRKLSQMLQQAVVAATARSKELGRTQKRSKKL